MGEAEEGGGESGVGRKRRERRGESGEEGVKEVGEGLLRHAEEAEPVWVQRSGERGDEGGEEGSRRRREWAWRGWEAGGDGGEEGLEREDLRRMEVDFVAEEEGVGGGGGRGEER